MDSISSGALKPQFQQLGLGLKPTSILHFLSPQTPIPPKFRVRATSRVPPTPQNPLLQTLKTASKALILSTTAALVATKFSHLPPAKAEPSPPLAQSVIPQEIDGDSSALSQFLESRPEAVHALKSLLQQKLEAGEDSDAIRILRCLVASQPAQLDWKFLLARVLNENGELDEARQVFEEILAVDPLSFEALFENAVLMDRCGEGEAVLRRLEEALSLAHEGEKEKEARNVRLIMAQIQFLQKDVEEALESYRKLAEEDPTDFRPYFCRGVIYSLLDRNAEGREELKKYRELSPKEFVVEGFLQTPLSRTKLFGTDSEN